MCHFFVMLSMLSVTNQSFMLSVIMLNVIMVIIVMLSVVAFVRQIFKNVTPRPRKSY
jgi:hypothetical protein